MRRTSLTPIAAVAMAFAAMSVAAQSPSQVARVGVLNGFSPTDDTVVRGLALFRAALAERGWSEGRNLVLDFRFAHGRTDHATELAMEASALKPDVILVSGTPIIVALKRTNTTIPVVMINATDPVGTGLVQSLARPGGNMTGFSSVPAGMGAKWLEVLREIRPSTRAVAVLFNPDAPPHHGFVREIADAADAAKVAISTHQIRSPADIERSFGAMAEQGVDALIVLPHPVSVTHRKKVIELAQRNRLPAIYPIREFADDGGLLAYGSNVADLWRRSADYVDRILRGARPGELPLQQPTKFEFIVNLKAAGVLGIAVPQSILLRADEVIE
jgi:putative ABC transport system substrate-binding protein